MIYLDNSATSFPKPPEVKRTVMRALDIYGGNPGRGGHKLSIETAEQVYKVRQSAAEFFGAETENTVFTANCTMALNMAIKGMMEYGGHIIISGYEHNAVLRPVYALAKARRVTFSVLPVYDDPERTADELRKLIRRDTRAVCCTVASNVSGRILPCREISKVCRSCGICFIADAAQAAGILDLKLSDGFDFICTAGHKALYGPTGTGLLISNGEYTLSTMIEGGTGTNSADPEQGDQMPERLESGTVNTAGILGLGAGIEFVKRKTPAALMKQESALVERFEKAVSRIDGVKLYPCKTRVPISSFDLRDMNSQALSMKLSERGFALRGGLHCAGLAHRSMGTLTQGTVRLSPGAFTTAKDIDMLAAAVGEIAAEK